ARRAACSVCAARPPFVQEALSSRAFRLRRSPTNTRRRLAGTGCSATGSEDLAPDGGRLSYEALVTRSAPLTGMVGECRHERAINQEIRQLEHLMNGGIALLKERAERVSGVNGGVYTARFESAEQGRKRIRLSEWLASDDADAVARLAQGIQQRIDED